MDNKAKQALINQLSKTSVSNHPLMIKYRGTTLATILPVEDHQKFQAEREEKLKDLKNEKTNNLKARVFYTLNFNIDNSKSFS